MINVCLTQPAPLHYSGNASAKSEAQRGNWLRAGIAAMRLFLYLKKFCPFVFNGRICVGGFGLPGSYRFPTCTYPPTTAARSVMVFSETDKRSNKP